MAPPAAHSCMELNRTAKGVICCALCETLGSGKKYGEGISMQQLPLFPPSTILGEYCSWICKGEILASLHFDSNSYVFNAVWVLQEKMRSFGHS